MNFLKLRISSPEKLVFEESELLSVTIPTANGEITILPGHIPLVSKVIHGEIVARKRDKEHSLITTEGFLKLSAAGEIEILSDYAERSEDIEIAKVERAKKLAEETMREKKSESEFILAEAELRKTLLELKIAQKRRSKVKGI
ncbi:ATP synthase F1 subunit epsilon [Candidatus Woesebacteria bacterium RIFCSPHIGHO2_01_FULL_38_9]|uniref:ATP synthase epsilon chain n=2 Tax=Candidatus Woeseibacteriota TaxID=1752722 RepID=A0A1F7XZQ0_9BACT|nr:MAG: ATP synthase F1 subunit epsilon [Candidatus Woesebacteria bacterium RIFCSPHIGHO2_01_FULL_38_9]OGM60084.1 MAG: ATP synthase F1 subunit epsilon [Candidatus Woesebacteria bacterium RIFCSPLOWO2_01_FULL_39_10]